MLRRLPVRVRVTLAFACAMALVLAATGAFVYVRLGDELSTATDEALRARAGDLTALIQGDPSGVSRAGESPLTERGDNLAQVLDTSGGVVDATPAARSGALLTRDELQRALVATMLVDRDALAPEGDPARLLATPLSVGERRLVVVVGAYTGDRKEAQANLLALLLIGGPVALLFASLAGYGVAAAALRPVERMRRRAAEIQLAEPGARLPVPARAHRDEIGRLGETLNAMLDRLDEGYRGIEAALARERALVSDASHELRTPLAILRTELELALRGERDADALRAALVSAAEETERLVRLAEDLLVLARSDQGQLALRSEEVPAGELIRAVERRFGAPPGTEPPVDLVLLADRLRLEQALGNLVDNALRHGGRHVELSAVGVDGTVELHVRDDGPGFPPGFLERAFQRFARADPARGRGGAGLGLAIVEAIAHAHGGTVGARNRPEGGADVWLAVPRR